MVALALWIVYELLLGRLSPFSPMVVGFSRQEHGSYVLYHHGPSAMPPMAYLNDVVAMEEKYHGMSYKRKQEIFFCKDDGEFHRRTGGRARFIAVNGRLFVSQRAQEDARQGRIDLRTYLTHEMSHCLLQQHMSVWRSATLPRWLLEGIAMDCAEQVGTGVYPSKSQVFDAMAQGVFCEPEDFGTPLRGEKGTALSCKIDNRTAFIYSEFGCLVEFIRAGHATGQYQSFLKDIVASRVLNVERSFESAFGTRLDDEIALFKKAAQKR